MFAIDVYRAVLGSIHGIFKMKESNKCFIFSVLGLVRCCPFSFSIMIIKLTWPEILYNNICMSFLGLLLQNTTAWWLKIAAIYHVTVLKVEIGDKMLAGLVLPNNYEEESISCLSLIWSSTGNLLFLSLWKHYPSLCLFLHIVFSEYVCLCSNFSFL